MQSVSLKNMLNFNRLYQTSSLSEILNIYALAGAGYDFYEYSSGNEQLSGEAPSFMGGLGVELSVGKAFDIFSQYELKFSSNGIDNINSDSRFVQIGMASAGIRINFGRDDARPLKHKPRFTGSFESGSSDFVNVTEEPPNPQSEMTGLPQDDVQPQEVKQQEEVERATRENERIRDLTDQLAETEKNYNLEIEELTNRLKQLQEEIDSLENKNEELHAKTMPVQTAAGTLRRDLNPGYYVQVFTGREYDNAERVKTRFRSLLSAKLENVGEKVFVKEEGPYYVVLIGNLAGLPETREIHKVATGEFPDSFIIQK